MKIRTADISDNAQLLALTRLTPMQGRIPVCLHRGEDFFSVLKKKGSHHTLVATADDQIIGCVSIIHLQAQLAGQLTRVGYCCDLKVHPLYRNRKVATQLSCAMNEHLLEADLDIAFSTYADGNHKVIPLFYGGNAVKHVQHTGKFFILQFVPRLQKSINDHIRINEADHSKEITDLLTSRYVYHAAITEAQFNDCTTFSYTNNGTTDAILCVADTSSMKQTIVSSVPLYLRPILAMMQAGNKILDIPLIPKAGKEIRILYVRYFGFRAQKEDQLIILLEKALDHAYLHGYHFLSMAFHENDPLYHSFKRYRHFPFVAHGAIAPMKRDINYAPLLKGRLLHEDFSLI